MYCMQEFLRERICEDRTGKKNILLPIINPKFPQTINCSVPACEYFIIASFKKRSTGTTKFKPLPEKQGALTRDNYQIVYFVSANQFICKTPRQLPTCYGRDS